MEATFFKVKNVNHFMRKQKHQSLSFILHVILYGKYSGHEKRRLDWDMNDLMMKFQ